MTHDLCISAEWEHLDEGGLDERACFGAIGIRANGHWLSEGRDSLVNRLRQAPLLSGVHLAEWLVWNWWRLRWEPRSSIADGWRFAHKTSNIGGGYIWPNITIFSDGERTALIARPTSEREDTPFRYISNSAAVLPSTEFEKGIDEFLVQIIARLDEQGVTGANLQSLWSDLCAERVDPVLARYRKMEAMLGMDPDEADSELIAGLIEEGDMIGEGAIGELAANRWNTKNSAVLNLAELSELSRRDGFDWSPQNMVKLDSASVGINRSSETPAWMVGARAAKLLREQQKLGNTYIPDQLLTKLVGVDGGVLSGTSSANSMSYAFDIGSNLKKIVLRSKYLDGRRFELARVLGDRLLNSEGTLFPATRAYTYRQKVQRAFAAELLAPFEEMVNMLQSDYSDENLHDVGEHFGVSDMTIRTQLVNHRILEREDLDPEVFAAAA